MVNLLLEFAVRIQNNIFKLEQLAHVIRKIIWKDDNMNIQSSEHILLTGAGFTKNFGGLLAREMWSVIFNHNRIQAHLKIKELLRDDLDYESVYTSIMEGSSYKKDEKEAINDAVKFAYENIDTILREYGGGVPRPAELTDVLRFIDCFNDNRIKSFIGTNNVKYFIQTETGNKSFIFTLNQDLFFERLCSNCELSIPGIKNNSEWFASRFRSPLSPSDYCNLPKKDELNHIKPDILSDGNFFLIKLHGSCNWISFDGTQKMVIGRGKKEQIQKEPLLTYYSEVFKKALSQYQRRLLIIGYSFGDEHINHIIAEAVREYELKIYIVSPDLPDDFKKELVEKKKFGKDIWQGVSGYFPYSLIEIFPEDSGKKTQASKDLFKTFFEQL
jgi:hypothetical protein